MICRAIPAPSTGTASAPSSTPSCAPRSRSRSSASGRCPGESRRDDGAPYVAAALAREPAIARRARFVGMHGSVRRGYGGSPEVSAEYNVRVFPQACRRAFAAGWDVTITPLDTCGLVTLEGERYRAVRQCEDPLVQALLETYRIWAATCEWAGGLDVEARSSVLFDTVAVYLAFSEELLEMERLGMRVTDEGYTVVDEGAREVDCAMGWRDLPAFEDLLVRRLVR